MSATQADGRPCLEAGRHLKHQRHSWLTCPLADPIHDGSSALPEDRVAEFILACDLLGVEEVDLRSLTGLALPDLVTVSDLRDVLAELAAARAALAAGKASVKDAAHELNNLIVIHDNGGTASSPKKIKKAARELLRLIDEGTPE